MTKLLLITITLLLLFLIILGIINPTSNWRSYLRVFILVLYNRTFSLKIKLRQLSHLVKDLFKSPFYSALWWIDELIFSKHIDFTTLRAPTFIISQPRCGSTFLHRTLSKDRENFFAITYLEWHWPYICVWWIIDRLKLRNYFNRRNYWSQRNLAAKVASQMHPHLYGDYEEHGIFLEEKFYQHYFVFRRFPFIDVLRYNANFNNLTIKQQERILNSFLRVVKKVAYYRGRNRSWLTKENESVDFYRALFKRFGDARLLFLVREVEDMLSSYAALSRTSTLAKTGIDIKERGDLYKENIQFRRSECFNFYKFYMELNPKSLRTVLINYDSLLANIPKTIDEVYDNWGIELNDSFKHYLIWLSSYQSRRERSYETSSLNREDLFGFGLFKVMIEQS